MGIWDIRTVLTPGKGLAIPLGLRTITQGPACLEVVLKDRWRFCPPSPVWTHYGGDEGMVSDCLVGIMVMNGGPQ